MTKFLPALFVFALALSACTNSNPKNEILIGEYASLTGTTASYGQSSHKGLAMAIEEINAKGGVLGKKIRLITEDDQSKPEEAASAVTKLINRDKVKAIIGEFSSSKSLAAAPICQFAKIPMLSPGSTNPDVTKKGDYIFRNCFIDPFQGEVLAKFAYNSLHIKRVAILTDVKNDYSVGLTQFFIDTFKALGGTVIVEQAYSEGDTDFKAQLTAIKSKKPEAIFLPGYYTEAALIMRQARELNIMLPFIGGDGWDSAKLFEIGGDAINGSFYSNHYSSDNTDPIVQNFVQAYKAKYNQVPDAIAALGYDSGKMLADAITRAGSDEPEKIKMALASTKDLQGVTGKITINQDRNAIKPAVILAIRDGKLEFKESVAP